ncbi:hypothetical protein FQN57_006205 [Myotisia sp. PD_48]|nr:hypothetical protein FQN57_006205 [Myotisia sp. PD_48]
MAGDSSKPAIRSSPKRKRPSPKKSSSRASQAQKEDLATSKRLQKSKTSKASNPLEVQPKKSKLASPVIPSKVSSGTPSEARSTSTESKKRSRSVDAESRTQPANVKKRAQSANEDMGARSSSAKRKTIITTRSISLDGGKGTRSTIIPIGGGSSINLTIRSISANGKNKISVSATPTKGAYAKRIFKPPVVTSSEPGTAEPVPQTIQKEKKQPSRGRQQYRNGGTTASEKKQRSPAAGSVARQGGSPDGVKKPRRRVRRPKKARSQGVLAEDTVVGGEKEKKVDKNLKIRDMVKNAKLSEATTVIVEEDKENFHAGHINADVVAENSSKDEGADTKRPRKKLTAKAPKSKNSSASLPERITKYLDAQGNYHAPNGTIVNFEELRLHYFGRASRDTSGDMAYFEPGYIENPFVGLEPRSLPKEDVHTIYDPLTEMVKQ